MQDSNAIDFVILWVDGADPVWREKKVRFTGVGETEGNTAARYRDWDTLKYWFRGVEKYAPWVRYVHFVTDNQKPAWLNLDHPKLKWVKHTDFIPEEYLPTFSANPIELNMHRIEGLAENFVYFNDDVFLIRETEPTDFFMDGMPCDQMQPGILFPTNLFSQMMFNNMCLINRNFRLNESIRKNPGKWMRNQSAANLLRLAWYGRRAEISNVTNAHIHVCHKKSTFELVWQKEYEALHSTCKNPLRTKNDVTSWCIRDWNILAGDFYPKKPIGRMFGTAEISHSSEALDYLKKQRGKVICLNDSENENDFEKHKQQVLEAFQSLLPEKSGFEL